jgi:L-lactate dehydrogenase complex protein LldE
MRTAVGKTALFVPCLVDAFYPQVAEAMLRLLRGLGREPLYPPEQTCCGQPAHNAGFLGEAAAAARRFIAVFEPFETVVCPSGACVYMVRHHYPELFKEDRAWLPRARETAGKVFELSEFLVDRLGVTDVGARFAARVTYHDSCHLRRGLGIGEQPRRLLRRVAGLALVEMPDADRCCGFGGSFAVKYGEISSALAADKVRDIQTSGAEVVTGCDVSCLMNIQGLIGRRGLPIRVLHLAEILSGGREPMR